MNQLLYQVKNIRVQLDILEKAIREGSNLSVVHGDPYKPYSQTAHQPKKDEALNERDLVNKCLDAAKVKGWETEFLESLKRHVYSGKRLTIKQSDALLKIQDTLGI